MLDRSNLLHKSIDYKYADPLWDDSIVVQLKLDYLARSSHSVTIDR
jgi:hypothetical protein